MFAAPAGAIAEANTAALAQEIAAFLAAQPKWGALATADVSFGYKDNLLLSYADEERSAFVRGSASFLALRVPTGSVDASFFLQADGTRYFSGRAVNHDAGIWLHSEVACRRGAAFKFSLPVTGYYSDKVFDVSDTEIERFVARQKVTGGIVGPMVRWNLSARWWLEAQANGERQRYADGANDARVGDGVIRVGWKPAERVETRLIGTQRWWDFDERVQYSAAGRPLFGTALKLTEREGQARIEITWDADAHWQTETGVSLTEYRDNGSGYFNFRRKKAAHEVRWKNERWLVRLEGIMRRSDFEVRTVGFGIDPPLRIKDEYSAEFRVERMLNKRWTVWGGYTWERSRSNDLFASYRMNEALFGLRWSWER
ncbi:MAG: hypothetical protein ABIQ12_09410 [Opitutaceae bacterium]